MLGADEGSFEIGRYLMMDAIRKTLREAIRGTQRYAEARRGTQRHSVAYARGGESGERGG
jgi:hypothetical protein